MFKKLLVSVLCVLISVCVLFGCSSETDVSSSEVSETEIISKISEPTANAETQTITDSLGRSVEIPNPVTSCVVANAYNTEIINAIGAFDRVIGVDYNIYQDKESWKNAFTEDMVIGKDQKDLNYEKIIELNPQVLILTGNGTYEEAESQLEPFGIKVIVCDAYYTDQFEEN